MLLKFLSLFALGLGVFLLVQVAMPLAAFKVWEVVVNNQNIDLADPSPKNEAVLGVSIENIDNFPAFIGKAKSRAPYLDFSIAIPSIDLKGAKVLVETNEFDQNLAHLPGSALPGEKGNVFVTGHSSLIQLFRQDNYKAIFANLPKVKKGDEIVVAVGAVKYRYIVDSMKIVDPKEVWVVNPPDSQGRYLSLMTCVPPGFNTKRLVVLAKLQS